MSEDKVEISYEDCWNELEDLLLKEKASYEKLLYLAELGKAAPMPESKSRYQGMLYEIKNILSQMRYIKLDKKIAIEMEKEV